VTVVPIQGEKAKKGFKTIQLKNPLGLTLDHEGNIYFCDYNNRLIRKLITSTGELQLPNGIKNAKLSNPTGVILDKDGNIFFSDWSDQTVKRLGVNGKQAKKTPNRIKKPWTDIQIPININ
jgi:streptogramin lyase